MELSDRELLIRFAVAREEQAFVTLVRRYERLVRAACRRVLRDVHLADDAFQATFLVLAARAKTLCHRHESLGPWLYTVASNAALQLRRSRKRAQRREQHGRPVTEESALSELLGMLDEELQRLDSEARDAIVLCHLQGLTQDDAAVVLGVSKSTLRRRIDRGMETLRGRFRRRGLLVPMFAVLWNAVAEQDATAAETSALQPLAESARQLAGSLPRGRHDGQLSETSWNLSQRVLAMSRWNRLRWCAWGLSAGVILGVGFLPVIADSAAAEKTAKPAKVSQGKGRASRTQEEAQSKPSPGGDVVNPAPVAVAVETQATGDEEQPTTTLAAVKKPKPQAAAKGPSGKAGGLKAGGAQQHQSAPGVLQAQGGNAISIAGGSSGGATATNTNGGFSGTVNINGKEYKTNNPAEFQRLLQMQQAAFPSLPGFPNLANGFPNAGNGAAAGGGAGGFAGGGGATSISGPNGFKGTVNINGKEQTFNNQADFDKALKTLNMPLPMGK